jgi:ABC-type sugar transport system permease subunit
MLCGFNCTAYFNMFTPKKQPASLYNTVVFTFASVFIATTAGFVTGTKEDRW